ncbi:hypothetical protein GKQ38_03870 [Candidatus Nanohaloarchaea archaeon]|nr:hypothetical protein GKQ38_03870 [Candidatus Nanohaloarchaea archaeon]
MLGLITVPGGLEKQDTDYASSNVLDSYRVSWRQNQGLFAQTALRNLANYSISNSIVVDNVENASENVFVSGTFNGDRVSNYTFNQWESRSEALAENSGFRLSSQLSQVSVEISNLTLRVETALSINYNGRERQTIVNSTFDTSRPITSVRDPYLVSRGYEASFNKCGFSSPISESLTISASDYNGTGYGRAAVEPSMASISDPIERVLVTSNPSNYTTSETDGFAAIVTSQSSISGSYNSVYASNVNISTIDDSEPLIVHEGEVYRSHFREIISESCYLAVSGYPGVEERFANNTVNYNGSVATFINETEISASNSTSSVGYEYFNGAGTLVEVAGVSYGRGNMIPWFRLSDSIASRLGISGLAR